MPRRHVSKRMEKLTQERGLLLRSPASKVGLGSDGVELTPGEILKLNTISDAAENLNWLRAKSAWESCKGFKAPLCNAAMHAAFRTGNYKYGAEIYAGMCKSGTRRTAITYTAAIRLFSQLKDKAKVQDTWEEAKRSNWSSWTSSQKYLLLNEVVNDAADAGNLTRIFLALDNMRAEGLQIDGGTWGAALNGCKKAGEPGVADFCLQQMDVAGISPNEVHYRCAVAAHAGEPLKSVRDVVSKAERCGIDILDRFFVDVHVAALLGNISQTSVVRSFADARNLVRKATPQHRRAAQKVISRAKARGTDLLRLAELLDRALREKRKSLSGQRTF